MKKFDINKIASGLFVLFFVNVAVCADITLPNFNLYRQEGSNTCWAACIRMIMMNYDAIIDDEIERLRKEEDIRRLAFGVSDALPAPDRVNYNRPTAELLARLLVTSGNYYGATNGLTPNIVKSLLDVNVPIVAAVSRVNGDGSAISGHMYVIAGYRGNGNDMVLFLANPDPDDTREDGGGFVEELYSNFVSGYKPFRASNDPDRANVTERWIEYIFPEFLPPAPKQIIVDKVSVPTKTITDGLARTSSGSNRYDIVHVWGTETYEEQVIIDSDKFVSIISTPWLNNPRIRFPNALRSHGVLNNEVAGIDIEGDNAVYNTGSLTLMHLNVSAASGYAINNTGTLYIDYIDRGTTVVAASSDAIYNTGRLFIMSGTVSAALGYAAIHNNSGTIDIRGETELKTASDSSGIAIHNYGTSGSLVLGGNPTITGHITGFSAGRVSVHTSGNSIFRPGDKRYILAPNNPKRDDIVVVGGANFRNNFELANTNFVLAANGNNLVVALKQFTVGKIVDALFNIVMGAISSAISGQPIVIIDEAVYEEQVTIENIMSDVIIKSQNPTFISRPSIKYFRELEFAPQDYAAFNMPNGNPSFDGNIEDHSTLRIFGAQEILIDGIDIEGDNGIYNSGSITIGNAIISAVSDFAIYNTGTVTLIGDTELHTAPDSDGIAIYNSHIDGSLVLGGSPVVNGHIIGFGAGKISVIIPDSNSFNPNGNKYTLSPHNLKSGDVVIVGGAKFIDNFELAASDFILAIQGNDLVAKYNTTATASTERIIPPPTESHEKKSGTPFANIILNEFSAGPNPVNMQSGIVNLFWQGAKLKNGTLHVYDALGSFVNKIKVSDNVAGDYAKRHIGFWNLKNSQGHSVPNGTYVIRGVITLQNGKKERISLLLSIG